MESANLLILEDDPDISDLLNYTLEREGFKLFLAKTGQDALSIMNDEIIDLAVLDVMLPDMSGVEVCRRIKNNERLADIPVLFVTAKNQETDKLIGFKVGGDDYMCKPFSPKELLARIKALLKRSKGSDGLRFHGLEIQFARHILTVDGKRVPTTPREFTLLKTLIEGQGKTISRSALLERAWGMESKAGLRSVDVTVTRIRDKLKPYDSCVRTVTGFGYQWDLENYSPANNA